MQYFSWLWVLETIVCRAWNQFGRYTRGICHRRDRPQRRFLLSVRWRALHSKSSAPGFGTKSHSHNHEFSLFKSMCLFARWSFIVKVSCNFCIINLFCSCTIQRTYTCRSMEVELVTTGLLGITRVKSCKKRFSTFWTGRPMGVTV